jgi:hypothetical protein
VTSNPDALGFALGILLFVSHLLDLLSGALAESVGARGETEFLNHVTVASQADGCAIHLAARHESVDPVSRQAENYFGTPVQQPLDDYIRNGHDLYSRPAEVLLLVDFANDFPILAVMGRLPSKPKRLAL